MFENHRKSRIQHCERSELRLHFEWINAKNSPFWRVFEKLKLVVKQCYQIGHFFIEQKSVENVKIKNIKWDILRNIQTLTSPNQKSKNGIFVLFFLLFVGSPCSWLGGSFCTVQSEMDFLSAVAKSRRKYGLIYIFTLFFLCLPCGFCFNFNTVSANLRKSLIQHCKWSELRLQFEWTG